MESRIKGPALESASRTGHSKVRILTPSGRTGVVLERGAEIILWNPNGGPPKSRIQHVPLLLAVLFLFLAGAADAGVDPVLNTKLEAAIATVRAMAPSRARFDAAEQLEDLVRKVPPSSVSDSSVNDLVSLLDDSDDVVRFFAAAALGHLGRRAKIAGPKLLALLPEADCEDGPVTSARSIRPALKRMGVKKLPPRPSYNDCHKPK